MANDKFNGFEATNDSLDFVDTLRNNPIGSPTNKNEFDNSHELSDDEDVDVDSILDQLKQGANTTPDEIEPQIEQPVEKTRRAPKKEKVVEQTDELEDNTIEEPANVQTTEQIDENESSQVNLLWSAFAEYNGLSVDEEDVPEDVEDFFNKINSVIEEKSTPKYGNNVIQEMDEFVKNGGDINTYFKTQQSVVDFENIDMDDSDSQKKVLGEFLSRKGFSQAQISKKIERYQDSDMLEDEAKDAYDSLVDTIKEEKEALLERQKNLHKEQEKQQQEFYSNVVGEIESVSDIRGIKIPDKDKRELMQYIFKVESDGLTKYQKDYNKSVRNLIESAYFTMKGDALINNAKRSGESNAVKKLKSSLASKQINKSSGRQNFDSEDLFTMLSGQLRN